MKQFALILCTVLVLLASPCHAAPLSVTVSITPLKYFTGQIGGDRVEVSIMVPAGANPATYEPRPRQMVALTKAKLFIAIGVPFEQAWLPRMRAANPHMQVVKARAGCKLMQMKSHHHENHGHGKDEHNDHGGHLDPHVWLSPTEAKTMASTILSALVQADPEGSQEYHKNYKRLLVKIETLDKDIRQLLAGKEGTRFLVYHPSWGYFARDYGLVQIPVELEGKNPGPRELAHLIKMAKENKIKVIFAQPQFSEKSARIVANDIGGKVVLVDPLAEDWANNLRRVARSIKEALR